MLQWTALHLEALTGLSRLSIRGNEVGREMRWWTVREELEGELEGGHDQIYYIYTYNT